MRRAIAPLTLLLISIALPHTAQAEIFYLGAHVGGEYFDLDAMSGGDVFDKALTEATTSLTEQGIPSVSQPEPTSYSSAGSFVWGIYTGLTLGRWVQLGARFTHSWMDIEPTSQPSGQNVSFDLQLITIMGEFMLRIPIRMFIPFIGIGVGFAYMSSDTTIIQGDTEATSELGTQGLDLMGALGLDINIGDHFAIGFAAQFSFVGYFFEDATESEIAWGFVNDYMARLTFRL